MSSTAPQPSCSYNTTNTAGGNYLQEIWTLIMQLKNTHDFNQRIILLHNLWRNTLMLLNYGTGDTEKIIQWSVSQTLDLMLMAKWVDIDKTEIKTIIENCMPHMSQWPKLLYRCNYIIKHIDNPWKHTTLRSIMGTERKFDDSATTTQAQLDEEREFFEMERGCMIALRLHKLIESKIDKHALNFSQKALQAIRLSTGEQILRQNVSVRQHQDLLEAYMSLLIKFQKYVQLKNEVESMDEGALHQFLWYSLETERVETAAEDKSNNEPTAPGLPKRKRYRLLKWQKEANQFAVQLYVMKVLNLEHFDDAVHRGRLEYFLGLWLHQYKNAADFRERFKKLVDHSFSRLQLYVACEKLHHELPNEIELFMQMYCRALTTDINYLQDKQYDADYDAIKIMELEKNIAPRYLFMGQALHIYPEVVRECVLTAFSLAPNQEYYDFLLNMARMLYPNLSIDSNGMTTMPKQEASNECTDMITQTSTHDETQAPSTILDTLVDLSESVRNDIASLLTTIRLKTLSWTEPWPKLNARCRELLNVERKLEIVDKTTAGYNSKLEFLHLNPLDYMHLKPRVFPGVERGYEDYYINASSSESNADDDPSYNTDSAPEAKACRQRIHRNMLAKKSRARKRVAFETERDYNRQGQPMKRTAAINRSRRTATAASADNKRRKPRVRAKGKTATGEQEKRTIPLDTDVVGPGQIEPIPANISFTDEIVAIPSNQWLPNLLTNNETLHFDRTTNAFIPQSFTQPTIAPPSTFTSHCPISQSTIIEQNVPMDIESTIQSSQIETQTAPTVNVRSMIQLILRKKPGRKRQSKSIAPKSKFPQNPPRLSTVCKSLLETFNLIAIDKSAQKPRKKSITPKLINKLSPLAALCSNVMLPPDSNAPNSCTKPKKNSEKNNILPPGPIVSQSSNYLPSQIPTVDSTSSDSVAANVTAALPTTITSLPIKTDAAVFNYVTHLSAQNTNSTTVVTSMEDEYETNSQKPSHYGRTYSKQQSKTKSTNAMDNCYANNAEDINRLREYSMHITGAATAYSTEVANYETVCFDSHPSNNDSENAPSQSNEEYTIDDAPASSSMTDQVEGDLTQLRLLDEAIGESEAARNRAKKLDQSRSAARSSTGQHSSETSSCSFDLFGLSSSTGTQSDQSTRRTAGRRKTNRKKKKKCQTSSDTDLNQTIAISTSDDANVNFLEYNQLYRHVIVDKKIDHVALHAIIGVPSPNVPSSSHELNAKNDESSELGELKRKKRKTKSKTIFDNSLPTSSTSTENSASSETFPTKFNILNMSIGQDLNPSVVIEKICDRPFKKRMVGELLKLPAKKALYNSTNLTDTFSRSIYDNPSSSDVNSFPNLPQEIVDSVTAMTTNQPMKKKKKHKITLKSEPTADDAAPIENNAMCISVQADSRTAYVSNPSYANNEHDFGTNIPAVQKSIEYSVIVQNPGIYVNVSCDANETLSKGASEIIESANNDGLSTNNDVTSSSMVSTLPHMPIELSVDSIAIVTTTAHIPPVTASTVNQSASAPKAKNPLSLIRRPSKRPTDTVVNVNFSHNYLSNSTLGMEPLKPSTHYHYNTTTTVSCSISNESPLSLPPSQANNNIAEINQQSAVPIEPLRPIDLHQPSIAITKSNTDQVLTPAVNLKILTKHCMVQLERIECTAHKDLYEIAVQKQNDPSTSDVIKMEDDDVKDKDEEDDDEYPLINLVDTSNAKKFTQNGNNNFDDDDYLGEDVFHRPQLTNCNNLDTKYQSNQNEQEKNEQNHQNKNFSQNQQNNGTCRFSIRNNPLRESIYEIVD